MTKYFGLRGKPLDHALIWAVIMPAYILFGYNNVVAGGFLSLPSWTETFPSLDTVHTTGVVKTRNSRVQGTVIAIYTLGCFFGSLACIRTGDKLGRKRTMMLGAVLNIIGAIIQCTSFSLSQLVIGRIVSGVGFGALSATAPNWQSECTNSKHRGQSVLLEGLFLSSGLAIAAWVDFGMSHVHGSISWRLPMAISIVWSLILLVTLPNMPESPRWLVKKGHIDQAREVLSVLNAVPVHSSLVDGYIDGIQTSLLVTGKGKFTDIFHNGPFRLLHRASLAACGQLFQQMSGINALAFYQATIFEEDLGLPSDLSRILGACVFTWQTLCSPLGVLTVDRLGRRKLMMFSAFGMGLCMAVVAGCSSRKDTTAAIGAAAAFIFLFSLFFPTGFLGLTFLYASEIAPLSVRVPITSISTATAWLFNFVVAEITPVGFATLGNRYLIIYAAINFFLILPGVYFFFPETSKRSLEEVDVIFFESKSIFDVVNVASRLSKSRANCDLEAMKADHTED